MRITIISLDNWGYNQYIINELKTYDYVKVNHINFDNLRYEYPSIFHKISNFFLKTIFNYNLKRNHLNKVILNKINELGSQDKILIIKADFLSKKTLKEIKKKTSQLIAFYNDNIKRCPRIKKVYKIFDLNFSFEREDAKKYNFHFITNYIYTKKKPVTTKFHEFDVFNITSLGKRNTLLENISIKLEEINVKQKIILVGKKKYTPKGGIIHLTKKLNIDKVNSLISKASVLLDVQQIGQEGLTFRVMESLAFNKKLITTNQNIKSYDFYNPKNILIVNPNKINIPISFFKNEYKDIPKSIYSKYTVQNWVKTVFNLHTIS